MAETGKLTKIGKTDSKVAKRLAKDLKENVERAKSALSVQYGDAREDDFGYKRSRTDIDDRMTKPQSRKGSAVSNKRKGSARQAFADEEYDDY